MRIRKVKGFLGFGFGVEKTRIQDASRNRWHWQRHWKVFFGNRIITWDSPRELTQTVTKQPHCPHCGRFCKRVAGVWFCCKVQVEVVDGEKQVQEEDS